MVFVMSFINTDGAFDITKNVLAIVSEKVDSVFVHSDSAQVVGLFDEFDFNDMSFLDDEEEDECRDVLWLKNNDDSEFQQFISIGKEPTRNCWSMEWGISYGEDSVPSQEFVGFGDENRVEQYITGLLGFTEMPK